MEVRSLMVLPVDGLACTAVRWEGMWDVPNDNDITRNGFVSLCLICKPKTALLVGRYQGLSALLMHAERHVHVLVASAALSQNCSRASICSCLLCERPEAPGS
jgi:hypothetical protein